MWSFDPVTQIAFTVGFVYAFNERSDRIGLWDTIRQLSNSSTLRNSPWVIMGDFNQVLSVSEMYSLYPVDIYVAGMMEFQECLNDSYLYDLSYQGCFFTWTNCSPSDPKSRKLDRALINEAFQDKFPNANAVFDSPGVQIILRVLLQYLRTLILGGLDSCSSHFSTSILIIGGYFLRVGLPQVLGVLPCLLFIRR